MSESLLHELQHAADLALKSETVQEGIHHLSRAFTLLSVEASRLKNGYSKLQERLAAVNQQLEVLLKLLPEAILFIDLEGMIAFANGAASRLLAKELEGIRFWDLFPDDHFGFSMRESLKFGIAHRLLYKSFPPMELEISSAFVFDGAKSGHGLVLILRNIVEKQRLLAIVNQADRMKRLGEMAAAMAHEIRNSLGGIRGFASLLCRDLAKDSHLQEMASSIVEGAKALEKLVSAVLHFSRPIQIQPQSADLGAFLKSTVKFVKADPAFPQNVRIAMNIPNAPVLAPFDSETFKSALLNLVFNAIQAMPEGGNLSLSLIQLEGCCQIAIADTGIGMDEDTQQHLFSSFFTTKKRGNGLGLVETQKIIHSHQGTIDVRSAPGRGSTFTITLPLRR